MDYNIIAISWNHLITSLDFRDHLSLDKNEIKTFLSEIVNDNRIIELAILSTCNRIEFYSVTDNSEYVQDKVKEMYATVLKKKINWSRCNPQILMDFDAICHLGKVSAGMESMVLGESQILSQVKIARQLMKECQPNANKLDMIFADMLQCAQEIHRKVSLTLETSSISDLVVESSKKLFPDLALCKILIIGAGEASNLTAHSFLNDGVANISISNRDEKRGRSLSDNLGGKYISFYDIHGNIDNYDIIIFATHSKNFLISKEEIKKSMLKREKPLLLIDISTPKNVDPIIQEIENVFYYDLDYLNHCFHTNRITNNSTLDIAQMIVQKHSQKSFHTFQLQSVVNKELELEEEGIE